jgi:hypothetical protein
MKKKSDYKMSKQVIPAVEAFWSQNKIIIESPLACTTGSAFRNKFSSSSQIGKHGKANSVNSPLSNELLNNFNVKKSTTSSVSTSGGLTSTSSEVKMTYHSSINNKLKKRENNKDQCKLIFEKI